MHKNKYTDLQKLNPQKKSSWKSKFFEADLAKNITGKHMKKRKKLSNQEKRRKKEQLPSSVAVRNMGAKKWITARSPGAWLDLRVPRPRWDEFSKFGATVQQAKANTSMIAKYQIEEWRWQNRKEDSRWKRLEVYKFWMEPYEAYLWNLAGPKRGPGGGRRRRGHLRLKTRRRMVRGVTNQLQQDVIDLGP